MYALGPLEPPVEEGFPPTNSATPSGHKPCLCAHRAWAGADADCEGRLPPALVLGICCLSGTF